MEKAIKSRKSNQRWETRLFACSLDKTNENTRCVSSRGLVRGKAVIHNRR